MEPEKPSLDLLRSLSDEHVVRALMQAQKMTRAELAARTGLSKPTVSDSIRRLTSAGLVVDTGERTTGRGGVGTFYAMAEDLGLALIVSVAPEGIVAESVDIRERVHSSEIATVSRSADPTEVTRTLRAVARRVLHATAAPVRVATVSAADPVARDTGRLVHLPDAPFLVGDLSPVDALRPLVAGAITVDNDVNWAARAERDAGAPGSMDDFAYLYLGEGLGCAVMSDGEVRRGHGGLAGEIAHLVTPGPRGQAMDYIQVFGELGLRREASTAIDVSALAQAVNAGSPAARRVLDVITRATCAVVSALVALNDPKEVVIGGSWGTSPRFLAALAVAVEALPRNVPVRAATDPSDQPLHGARRSGVNELRSAVVALARTSS